MKKGIYMGCLPGASAAEKFALARDAGFDGVQIPSPDDLKTAANLRDLAGKYGLEVPSIMGQKHWSHPLSSSDPQTRQVCGDAICQDLRHARAIGADIVLLVPGVVTAQVTYEQAWQHSMAEVHRLARVAEQHQVVLALENVWNKFLLSPLEFRRFLDDLASPFVKAYFDCGNILAYGFPDHWIRTLGGRIASIHVKGYCQPPAAPFPHSLDSDVNWDACRQAWQAIGYDGYLTVEIAPDPADPEGSIHRYNRQLDAIVAGER